MKTYKNDYEIIRGLRSWVFKFLMLGAASLDKGNHFGNVAFKHLALQILGVLELYKEGLEASHKGFHEFMY